MYRLVRPLLVALLLCTSLQAAEYGDMIRTTQGLLAHYSCDDEQNPLVDRSTNKADAQLIGDIVFGVDPAFPRLQKAMRLNKGAHLRVPKLGEHDAATVEMWLRVNKPPAEGIAGIFAADNWQAGFLHLNLRPAGVVEIAVNGVNGFPLSEPDTVPLGKWVHLVATYDRDAGEQKLYRDGRLMLEASTSPGPRMRFVEAAIGAWITGGVTRPLEADLDEIAMYSVALTPTQIRQHYAVAKGVAEKPVDFAAHVRPILEKRCFGCHGPETQESQLRLDVRDWAFRGGESGEPAVMPYAAEDSHLVKLVLSQDAESRMPPEGDALNEAEIALLKTWIDQGAIWPDEFAGHAEPEKVTTSHWSFQPVVKHQPPASDEPFVRQGNAIDPFILAKLHEKQLAPSPEADRRTLIRRLYFDMHGLPPTPEQVARFLNDNSPQAWERLVDEVLASPRYGERWASHWLDVIRYGDTHGFEVNLPRDNAWPFRDYVIKSLNDDKPYDRFIQEQIAGDQLGADAATGFLVAAPAVMPGQVGKDIASMRQARSDELHEIIVSVGSGVLGLTVGCARCHNHKFDPISQRDYYQLQAILAGVRYEDRPLRNPETVQLSDNAPLAKAVYGGTFTSSPVVHRLYRGDPMQRRERVSPDVPAVFGSLDLALTTSEPQRRLALAKWLTRPDHPLTARVMVNRIWQHHFGQGLVATPSDFGGMGVPPTHPELLDYLAATFVEQGWSLKKLHRMILSSSTYRQTSRPDSQKLAVDAGTQLLWRFPPRRLEMEPIRDSILAVSGSLDLTMGGPGFMVFKPNNNYVRVYDPKEEWGPGEFRRMIYAHRVRMAQDGVFGAFDCPDAGQPAPKRGRSTTAIQALNLLNSTFVKQQADIFAERVKREAGDDLTQQINRVFELAYNRTPSDRELELTGKVAREFGMPAVCRAVLNSNEFLFMP
jgi:hypothetical protein